MFGLNNDPNSSPGVAAAISLDHLHVFARYLEQSIVFGLRQPATQQQMDSELRGNFQRLSSLSRSKFHIPRGGMSSYDERNLTINLLNCLIEKTNHALQFKALGINLAATSTFDLTKLPA